MSPVGGAQDTIWPVPNFRFYVEFEGQGAGAFQEVSGLETESQVIEYRAGGENAFSTVKMPGLVKTGNVTLKRGIFRKNHGILDWLGGMQTNAIKRCAVTISLRDEAGKTAMVWTLSNACPTKVTGTVQNIAGDEVTIEMVELAHEGLTIENGTQDDAK